MSYMRRTIGAFVMAAAAAGTASAQQTASPKWQAWLGCWAASPVLPSAPVVCVSPTGDRDVVAVTTLSDGKVIARDSIDASGRQRALTSKECAGAQIGTWSADERRLFLRSAITCGNVRTATSTIMAMTQNGEWLDVRGMAAGEGENVRLARYERVMVPAGAPLDVSALTDMLSAQGARVAAGARIGTNAVIEASKLADEGVVEAWLLERGQPFDLNATTLIALADAGVPSRVTDAMVAVSNPKSFAFSRAEERQARADAILTDPARRVYVFLDPYDPWGYGYSRYRSGFGYSPYGYGYSPYGYNGYGNGYGNGYYPPIIITNGSNGSGETGTTASEPRGRMVKGQGYTQTERTSTSSGASTSKGTSSSGTSTGTSSGTTSQPSQPSDNSQRTAKPRP